MTIRITGLNSGLDTDSIITELIKAKSEKLNTLKGAQTKLEWKQTSWKTANSKIYSFYNSALSNMKYQSSYKKKSTTVSNTSIASVVAGDSAVNGSQSLVVKQLAKSGYLTGGKLSEDSSIKSSSTLNDALGAGLTGTGTIDVTAGGKTTSITLDGTTTIAGVVSKLNSAGVNASFDSTNQRIFVSVANSGASNDFSLTATNSDGLSALASLGLVTSSDITNNKSYQQWSKYYAEDDSSILSNLAADGTLANYTASSAATIQSGFATLEKSISTYQSSLTKQQGLLETAMQNEKYLAVEGSTSSEKRQNATDALTAAQNAITENSEKLEYLALSEKDAASLTDEEKTTLDEYEEKYDLTSLDKDTLTAEQSTLKENLATAKANLAAVTTVTGYETAISDLQKNIYDTYATMKDNALALNEYYGTLTNDELTEKITSAIASNLEYISKADTYAEEYAAIKGENASVYALSDTASYSISEDAKSELVRKVNTANEAINNADSYANNSAVRIAGQDAVISLNNAEFTSNTNNFTVNGLTITASQVSSITGYTTGTDGEGNEVEVPLYEETSINTADDITGVYDMVKSFFTSYNTLIKELDTLYNADSSKGYEPLTDEEKSSMTDDEIEQWEEKIKTALLRKDSDLGNVITGLKNSMLSSITIKGSSYNLTSFGIETLGYFNSEENERGCYHIDGDSADGTTAGYTDKLKTMIASDPDTVASFFTQLTSSMYDNLTKQMKSTNYSSIYTVYEDKKMKTDISDYDDKIDEAQEKLNDLEDKYYKQFSAMEVALSKLNSQQSSLSSILGSSS